jgi:uracil-DNA glycosylase family 4
MLSEKPDSCEGCPAFEWGIGFVPPIGPSNCRIAFVGQGPGESEAYSNVPFHPNAPSGSRLTSWLHLSHFQRCDVGIGNIVQCWLPKTKVKGSGRGNRDPLFSEIQWCWNVHVGEWLKSLPELEWVIPVGVPAAKFLLGIPWKKGGERYAGTVTLCELPPIGRNKCE